jgi:hypothetical protein
VSHARSIRGLAGVAIGAMLATGCATPLSGDIPAYPAASQLESDTQTCEQSATGRAEFERRADYMACMISRGYRTYVSMATYWTLAELSVSSAATGKRAQAQQSQSQVLTDLQTCATDAGAVAGARPLELAEAMDWVNVKVLGRGERMRDANLTGAVSACLVKRGYTTHPPKRLAAD